MLPKVQGTWNLHNALKSHDSTLDIFFLFSSAGGGIGQWGQANYNAGNTFLDAFVQYRHSLGMPASTVDIGVIEDVGYVAENTSVLDSLRATGQYLIQEKELLESIELAMDRSAAPDLATPTPQPSIPRYSNPSQISIGMRSVIPLSSPSNRTVWRKDPRMAIYRNIERQEISSSNFGNDELQRFLKNISSNMTLLRSPESAVLLASAIGKTLLGFMMRGEEELDLSAPLASMGIDSLISIELRNWMRRSLGIEFTVLEIVRADDITNLGVQAQEKLIEKYEARA